MTKRLVAAAVTATLTSTVISMNMARADEEVLRYESTSGVVPVTATALGLYKGSDFRLVRGTCKDCPTPQQALWYFRDDIVAVPADGVAMAGFTRGAAPGEDVRAWFASATEAQLRARPPLIWVGATQRVRDVTLTDANQLRFPDGRSIDFGLAPKIASNRSYYDDSSAAFLRKRPLRMRGELNGDTFTARTIWPQDWVIDERTLSLQPLLADETVQSIVRRHDNAKNETYEVRLLWERKPVVSPSVRDWSGYAVLGIMLNGAQGDDDEAHGGHFAVVTGRYAPGGLSGEMADWMVNNFYNLGSFSEKGITASMLPLDNYLADLNSGQSWYRPSYMLVAVLKSDRAAYAYQAAIARVFNHFYRNDFAYRHASANCAGISLDTLRALGWNIPLEGPTSPVKAIAAYPYTALSEGSLAAGRDAYNYLMAERTRLFPAVAYDAAGRDLLRMAATLNADTPRIAGSGTGTSLEAMLRDDLEALVFVRLPQLPSSRAFGAYPVASYDEYMARVPADKSQWKIVPVDPRPFPPELRDGAAPSPLARVRPPLPVVLVLGALLAGMVGALWRVVRRRRARTVSAMMAVVHQKNIK